MSYDAHKLLLPSSTGLLYSSVFSMGPNMGAVYDDCERKRTVSKRNVCVCVLVLHIIMHEQTL